MRKRILYSFICAVISIGFLSSCSGTASQKGHDSYVGEDIAQVREEYKHYFSALSEVEKQAYNCIFREIEDFPDRIKIPALNTEQIERVWLALMYDNPELFMFGKECTLNINGDGCWFCCDYALEKDEYDEKKKLLQEKVEQIKDDVLSRDTAFERELYIHDLIVDNCTYVNSDDLMQSTVCGVLLDGEASCEGYAKAAKLLLDAVEIDNYLVCGRAMMPESSIEGHMWNVVFLDGKPYNLDVTWDDPIGDESSLNKRYAYFNITDEEIRRTHSFDNTPPGCIYADENYFIKTGKLFESYDADMRTSLAEIIAKESAAGKVDICFSAEEVYESAIEGLFENEEIYRVLEVAALSSEVPFSTKQIKYINDDTHYILELILVS